MANFLQVVLSFTLVLTPFLIGECEAKNNILEISRMGVFKVAVLRNQKPVVVYFTQRLCSQCKPIQRELEKIASANDEKMFLALADMDKYPDLRKEFDITSVPTTRTYFNGKLLQEINGPLVGGVRAIANNAIRYGEENSKKKS